jgi:hypothetical protein
MYDSGQMVASWERDDNIPTLSMAPQAQDSGMFTDSGTGYVTF